MSDSDWYLLGDGKQRADYNMAMDEALLETASERGRAVLRFYGWQEPAATFGYSQRYGDIERWTMLRPLVRRPTGGGLVPHDADWTYSVAIPPGHAWYQLKATESYCRIHEWIRDSFARLNVNTTLAPEAKKEVPGQCFIGAEKSDVLWHGRKIAGAAQRRTRAGLLIQGSVQPPPIPRWGEAPRLSSPKSPAEPAVGRVPSRSAAPLNRHEWQSAMREVAETNWAVKLIPLEVGGHLAELVRHLQATKYSLASYNQKR